MSVPFETKAWRSLEELAAGDGAGLEAALGPFGVLGF